MNVTTTDDGPALILELSLATGGLEGLRDEARFARSMLAKTALELPVVKAYQASDAHEYRTDLARRLRRMRRRRDEANRRLWSAQQIAALHKAQTSHTSTLAAPQVAHCVKVLTHVEAWLSRLSLGHPAADDFHTRLLMRDEVAGIRDLLLSAATHPVTLTQN